MRFTIITPTVANPLLPRLLQSINALTLAPAHSIEHLLVVDGPLHKDTFNEMEQQNPVTHKHVERHVFHLPYSTGHGGFLGHKIYAAISQLSRADYVLFVDDDNCLHPDHISSFVRVFETQNYDWAFCLRQILGTESEVLCEDLCESLGHLHPVFYNSPADYLIDTNCYCIRRDVLTPCSPLWNRKATNDAHNPDRVIARFLMEKYPKFTCTNQATLLYQTGNRSTSVKTSLFLEGNRWMLQRYRTPKPWTKPHLYLVHFNQENTERLLNRVYGSGDPRPCVAWEQWQLNLADRLADHFWLRNAYSTPVPTNSNVLVHMCHAQELPVSLIKRDDICKILTTIESPNIRHTEQWSVEFLRDFFQHIITYWDDLLQIPNMKTSYFPFVGRFDMTNMNDLASMVESLEDRPHTVAMVLENRPFHSTYTINGRTLHAQDSKRSEYAVALGKKCHCYGKTWLPLAHRISHHETKSRFDTDAECVLDLYRQHTFTLIIENCNAVGYVSEKIYDAWTAGCIPLYYGNADPRLDLPEDMFIDIRGMTPVQLSKYIRTMDSKTILNMRKRIVEKRHEVFRKNSVDAYARHVSTIVSESH